MSTLNSNKPLDNPSGLVKDCPNTTMNLTDQSPKTPWSPSTSRNLPCGIVQLDTATGKGNFGIGKSHCHRNSPFGIIACSYSPAQCMGSNGYMQGEKSGGRTANSPVLGSSLLSNLLPKHATGSRWKTILHRWRKRDSGRGYHHGRRKFPSRRSRNSIRAGHLSWQMH